MTKLETLQEQRSKLQEQIGKEEETIRQAEYEVFFAPIVYHPGGWEDTLPEDIKQRVIVERLELQAKGEWDHATDAEVICYLYTASLAAPLSGDWTEIYVYLVAQWKPDLRDAVEVRQELSSWQRSQLQDLKRRMRDSQIRQRKKAKSQARKEE